MKKKNCQEENCHGFHGVFYDFLCQGKEMGYAIGPYFKLLHLWQNFIKLIESEGD